MRNYKTEYEYQKTKYDCIRAFIPKDTGQKLRVKLRKENKPIAKWLNDNALKYIKE